MPLFATIIIACGKLIKKRRELLSVCIHSVIAEWTGQCQCVGPCISECLDPVMQGDSLQDTYQFLLVYHAQLKAPNFGRRFH